MSDTSNYFTNSNKVFSKLIKVSFKALIIIRTLRISVPLHGNDGGVQCHVRIHAYFMFQTYNANYAHKGTYKGKKFLALQ